MIPKFAKPPIIYLKIKAIPKNKKAFLKYLIPS